MRSLVLSIAAMLLLLAGARAHESRPAYLELRQMEESAYDLFWKKPAGGIADTIEITLAFPPDCRETSARISGRDEAARFERWTMQCEKPLAGRSVTIEGLQSTQMNVLVRLEASDGSAESLVLSPAERTATFAEITSSLSVVQAYFVLGVEHIWFGIDHLLFVLTLLLLADGWRRLLALITAFTVAHSITLSLASLSLATVPGAPVEALIALSIVLAAAEGIKPAEERTSLMARAPWVVAFAFGLLHGFGFAGALSEIGLPQSDVLLSLLFFNVGVEAGQIAFVACVIGATVLLGRLAGRGFARTVGRVVTYGAGSIAAFWFFERAAAVLV
ncbi:MAG: HupE/UreJ family protein [Roseibium sp.]